MILRCGKLLHGSKVSKDDVILPTFILLMSLSSCFFPFLPSFILPNIRIVFPNRKKTIENNEIVHKKYVFSEETYFFGPLHCGKTRER